MTHTDPILTETAAPLGKLQILVDIVFRRLFNEPRLLASLLNGLLELQGKQRIASLTLEMTQLAGPLATDKEALLDVRAHRHNGERFHIEVQLTPFTCYAERALYYWAGLYHGQLAQGGTYKSLRPVYSIHLLDFTLLKNEPGYQHVYELRERRSQHRLTEHLQLRIVEVPKFLAERGALVTEGERWLYYLAKGHTMEKVDIQALEIPEINDADEKLQVLSQDRRLRVEYENRLKAKIDADSLFTDYLIKGRREGVDLGQQLATRQHLRLLCHEDRFDDLIAELALHRLDVVLSDRPAPVNRNLKVYSHPVGSSALAATDRFIKLHPTNPAVDYAYYLKGLISFNEDLGWAGYISTQDPTERDPKALRESFDAFRELATRFPNSKYTPDAIQRMNYLVNAMASHEVHVARYYYNRGAYVAAANRAQSAIKTFPSAPAVEQAMAILVASYDKLGMIDLRDDAERVMRKNFPDSRYYVTGITDDKKWWHLW